MNLQQNTVRPSLYKKCSRCKKVKTLQFFSFKNSKKRTHKNTCKACDSLYNSLSSKEKLKHYYEANRDEMLQKKRIYTAAIKEKKRIYDILKKYNLTLEKYRNFLRAQNSKCLGCGAVDGQINYGRGRHLVVDHCHESGEVRGLLCSRCNLILGMAKENPQVLMRLRDYYINYYDAGQCS